jgi:hypothetical protein
MEETLRIRPHHLKRFYEMNSHGNYVKSFLNVTLRHHYNPKFAFRYVMLARRFAKNPDMKVEIVPSADDVCRMCKPRAASCTASEKIPGELGIEYGRPYTAGELMSLADEHWNDFDLF